MELTTKRRNKLPDEEFADPKNRKYPIDTRARAANAKARVLQQLKLGQVTRAYYDQIVAAAERKLAEK